MTGSPHVHHLIEQLRAARDPFEIMANARALARMGGEAGEAVEELLSIVREVDSGRSAAAAYVLSEVGAETMRGRPDQQDALAACLDHANAEVRQWTAVTVAQLGASALQTKDALIRLLDDSDEGVRIVAAHALGQVAPAEPQVWDALMQTMDDESPAVRSAAVRAMACAEGDAAPCVPVLVNALTDASEPVRACAAETLGRLGASVSEAGEALLARLSDSSADVRVAALRALEQITGDLPDGRDAVIASLDDRDERVRAQAISLTERWGLLDDAKTSLMWLLNDREPTVRFYALGALEQAMSRQAPPIRLSEFAALSGRLLDDSALVRERAGAVLSMLGQRRDEIEALLRAQLALDDPTMRLTAVLSARHMPGYSEIMDALRERLSDGDERVAVEAAAVLAGRGHWDGEVQAVVGEGLLSKQEACRKAGLEALKQPGVDPGWAEGALQAAWRGLSPEQQRAAQTLRQGWMDGGAEGEA